MVPSPHSVRVPLGDERSEGINVATATAIQTSIEKPATIFSKLIYPIALLASLSIWLLALRAPLWLDETLPTGRSAAISGRFGAARRFRAPRG